MNIQKFYVVEANRLSSQKVKIEGVDANNKASWNNEIKPILLKKGDQVNLEQSIISQKGANSNSIEFNGVGTDTFSDNFTLMENGFYLNHNGTNSLGIPFIDTHIDELGNTDFRQTKYNVGRFSTNNSIDNKYMSSTFFKYFNYETFENPVNDNYFIRDVMGVNPFQTIDSKKYAKIKSNYLGWYRNQDGVRGNIPSCELELTNTQLSLKQGFLNPQSVADTLTLELNSTLPLKSNSTDDKQLVQVRSNQFASNYNVPLLPLTNEFNQFQFNGNMNISTTANLFTENYLTGIEGEIHPLYQNLYVENPYKYKYGINLIQDTDTYRLNEEPDDTLTDTADPFFGNNFFAPNTHTFTGDYPVFLYSYYRETPDVGGNPNNINDYQYYMPYETSGQDGGTASTLQIKTTKKIQSNIKFHRLYRLQQTVQGNSRMLSFTGGKFQVVNAGSQQQVVNYPTVFWNNDNPEYQYYIYYLLWTVFQTSKWVDQFGIEIILQNFNAETINETVYRITGNGYIINLQVDSIYVLNGDVFAEDEITNIGTWTYNNSKITFNINEADRTEFMPTILNGNEKNIYFQGWYIINVSHFWGGHGGLRTYPKYIKFLTNESQDVGSGTGLTMPLIKDYNMEDGDVFSLTFKTNQNLFFYNSRLVENQLLITNMKFNLKNIKIIENYFKYNKIYDGTETNSNKIRNDIDNYYCNMDIGRTLPIPNHLNKNDITGVIPGYIKDNGIMGEIDTTNINEGSIYPRLNYEENNYKQQVQIKTSYQEKYWDENYVVYEYDRVEGSDTYSYASLLTEDFVGNFKEELDYIKNNNIGIIPLEAAGALKTDSTDENVLMIGFLVKKNYIDNELLKIQTHNYFGVSPSPLDILQITSMNYDGPSFFDPPIQNTEQNTLSNYTNFINLGAPNPTISFNNDFQQFTLSFFHTPVYQNIFNSSADDVGNIVARFNDDKLIIHDYWLSYIIDGINPLPIDTVGKQNIVKNYGVNDSQCGVFIHNFYLQEQSQIFNITSPEEGTEINFNNYYNSLLFKLGFKLTDFLQFKFTEDDFANRFQDLYHNSLENINNRKFSLRPFTTNSDININAATSSNVYGFLSQYRGQVQYNLGFINAQPLALKVSTAFMKATSIPRYLSTPFFRIFTNIPLHTLEYQNDGNELNCIGIALRNYSNSGFYYSYAQSFSGTLTKDILLTDIKTEIRNTNGNVANNIGDNSVIIYKITSVDTISLPLAEQQEQEQQEQQEQEPKLKNDKEKDIESGNSVANRKKNGLRNELSEREFTEVLDRITADLRESGESKESQRLIEESIQKVREQETRISQQKSLNFTDEVEEDIKELNENPNEELINDFIRKVKLQAITNIVLGAKVPASYIKAGRITDEDKRKSIEDISKAISSFFNENNDKIDQLANIIRKEGRDAYKNPEIQKFIQNLGQFRLTSGGDIILDEEQSSPTLYEINEQGATRILEFITNKKISQQDLTTTLIPFISQLFDSKNIDLNLRNYAMLSSPTKIIDKRRLRDLDEDLKKKVLDDNITEYLIERLNLNSKQIREIKLSKNYKDIIENYNIAKSSIDEPNVYADALLNLNKEIRRIGIELKDNAVLNSISSIFNKPQQSLKTTKKKIKRKSKEELEQTLMKEEVGFKGDKDEAQRVRRGRPVKDETKLRVEEEISKKIKEEE